MRRYHFHLHECGSVVEDDEGCELQDLADARDRAILAARDIMSAEVKEGRLCLACCIIVADGQQKNVLRVDFRDIIKVTGM